MRMVGPYRLVRKLGRGGMGQVYLAVRDDEAFKRYVAVKVIRKGMDTEDILKRFRVERQILASLTHPNIARLLDGGATEDG
ncbi:MAG: protein kinase, partial [Bacteroidetes Order II. Incertae sedis bacterium]|nr:protein kinase [Bacteroidetes Order II. bacterium]